MRIRSASYRRRLLGGCRVCAAATPAAQPGARPPLGGLICVASTPAAISSQDTSELEFHMSPHPSVSRPQVNRGTVPTRESRDCASPSASGNDTGESTADARSGRMPSAQHRTSDRKNRDLPSQRTPTGPVATTPRGGTGHSPGGCHFDEMRHVTDEDLQRRMEQRARSASLLPGLDQLPPSAGVDHDMPAGAHGQPPHVDSSLGRAATGHTQPSKSTRAMPIPEP